MKNTEIWKRHPEYPFVEVSTFGGVRTLDRVVSNGKGTRLVKGHVLKQCQYNGYLRVGISINGNLVHKRVHRLVAQTFISNPDNLPQVNHKDCNRANNCVSNLEWCDNAYNVRYREKYGISQTGHPVYAINLKTTEVSRFKSQMEASRVFGISHGNIVEVIKGKYKQAKGYWFTNADNNAVEATRAKFGDVVADKVKKLMDNR